MAANNNPNSLDNKPFFMRLQNDYYYAEDEKEKLNLRNAIAEQLSDLMTAVVWQFSKHEFDYDMFQEVMVRTLQVIIPSWKPTKFSTDGFYRRSFHRACLNYIRNTKRKEEKEALIDPTIEWMWDFVSEDADELIFTSEFSFSDPNTQQIYEECLRELSEDRLEERVLAFINELWERGGGDLSRYKLREILDHAKITFRESYEHYMKDVPQEVDNETIFGRLSKYLEPEVRDKVMKIFGGCTVKIPDWKGE